MPLKPLTASLEDYLESLWHIIQEKKAGRVKDVAARLKVKAASVTQALQSLSEKQFITYEPYGLIHLTPEGESRAREIIRRHEVLKDFLVRVLGVEGNEAEQGACEMEHVVSAQVADRLVGFMDFITLCPRTGPDWLGKVGSCPPTGETTRTCQACLDAWQTRSLKPAPKLLTLEQLKPGQQGRVGKVQGTQGLHQRLLEMGINRGTLVEVVRFAPLGDPMEIKVRGYHLFLRKNEAENIWVEAIGPREKR